MDNDMPSKSEKKGMTPSGYGERDSDLGKGANMVKAPKPKSEAPGNTPKGYSAKGSKDEGKDAQTGHAGKEGKKLSKSEAPDEVPSGVNDMEIPHTHLPEMLHQKEGDEVHLHVYGKLKAHNMEKGKNHAVVEVHSVKRHGDEDQSASKAPSSANTSKMPMDTLKGILQASEGNEGKQQQRYGNKDNTPYAGY